MIIGSEKLDFLGEALPRSFFFRWGDAGRLSHRESLAYTDLRNIRPHHFAGDVWMRVASTMELGVLRLPSHIVVRIA